MNKNKGQNYLDQIPRVILPKWNVLDDGMVELKIEHKGFFYFIAQKFFLRPRISYIKLDAYGTCVFLQIDGKKSVYEIANILQNEHKDLKNQLYERVCKYFEILRKNKIIEFVK